MGRLSQFIWMDPKCHCKYNYEREAEKGLTPTEEDDNVTTEEEIRVNQR